MYNTRFLDIVDAVDEGVKRSLGKFAPNGLQLWNVFLPNPDVPPAIAANYRQVICTTYIEAICDCSGINHYYMFMTRGITIDECQGLFSKLVLT